MTLVCDIAFVFQVNKKALNSTFLVAGIANIRVLNALYKQDFRLW